MAPYSKKLQQVDSLDMNNLHPSLIISVYLQLGPTSFTTTVDEKLRGIWKQTLFILVLWNIERSHDSQIQPFLIGMIDCQPL